MFSWEYPTHAKRGEQENLPADQHRSTHTWSPHPHNVITFLSCFPATEACDQPPLVHGHQQHGQRKCLPPCQTLQATQQWQIPFFSLKTGPVRKGLYQFQLASCLAVGTDWYLCGDNKKKEGRPLSFSTHNFASRFYYLIGKTVSRRKRNLSNSISFFKYFGLPSWNHLTPSIRSFH